jgi:hypothetical protein
MCGSHFYFGLKLVTQTLIKTIFQYFLLWSTQNSLIKEKEKNLYILDELKRKRENKIFSKNLDFQIQMKKGKRHINNCSNLMKD